MSSRTLLKGAGCGVLMTLWYTKWLLGPAHFPVLVHRLPLATVFLAVLADLIVISLLASLVWAWIERLGKASLLWPIVLASVLLLEAHRAVNQYMWPSNFSGQVWATFGATLVMAAFALRWGNRTWFERATRALGWSLVLCGCPIFLVVPELVYMAARTSGHEALGFSHAETLQRPTVPRICWILFDELSYDQVYEHRADGLTLLNFDRLRGASTTFSSVVPGGDHTDIAIPAMFLGRPASQARSSASGVLSLYMSDSQRWERFDASKTIFADARRLGWPSGIVGWANPYCRLMAGWADDCYWIPEDDPMVDETNMDSNRGVIANAVSLPLLWGQTLIYAGTAREPTYARKWVAGHEYHYDLAMEHALALIQRSSIRFQFIHLPVPHPPAIFDRKTRRFSGHGSYLDNLALADVALGELLDQLEKTPEWPDTTLVVSGDHSWRPWIWQRLHLWTAEDQAASRGEYDPRPLLAIHLPGQDRECKIGSEFRAVAMVNALDAIMGGRIHTPDDLRSQIAERHGLK